MRFHPESRASTLAFVTAFVTLFTQVLVHRLVSAKLLNNFAFLVIALTMLGFAFSGVFLSRHLELLLEHIDDAAAASAALFGLSLVAVSAVFYRADVGVLWAHSRAEFLSAYLRCLPLALLYAVPFAFCGLILGLLLASPRLPTRQIYCFDLFGSALGAFAVIPAIRVAGVEAGLLSGAWLLLAAGLLLAPPRRLLVRALAGLCGAVLLLTGVFSSRVFDLRLPPGSPVAEARREGRLEYAAWDPVSRIEVMRIPPPDPATSNFPSLTGDKPELLARFQRMLSQNNCAPTFALAYDGRRESLLGIEQTIYAAAYQASTVPAPRAVIIGVGGGFDVLTALFFGVSRVDAVEVNAATVDILTRTYRDYFLPWVSDPRVHLVNAEGRAFLATSADRFDIIQVSGVDSFSGTPAAAHVFSESYLYTQEAFELYLDRLSPHGILNVMRYEYLPPHEMAKALTTALSALRVKGVEDPSAHIVMVGQPNGHFAALLLKRNPFRPEELARIEAWTEKNSLVKTLAAPGLNGPGANLYQVLLQVGAARARSLIAQYPFDIAPVDDDRPFFFRRSFWWHVFSKVPVVQASIPTMEYGVLILLSIVGAASAACIWLPLRWQTRGVPTVARRRQGAYFAGAGLGYLGIEMALLQKFGLFLGHPNYAVSVVLAALLLSTGLGSLGSAWIIQRLGKLRFVVYVLSGVVLLLHVAVFPRLLHWIGLPLPARVLVVFGLVLPIGVCLGVFLPAGIERLKATAPSLVPWAWGVNGIFSVLAPILSVAISMTWGISALMLTALPIYLLVGFAYEEAPASAS